MQRINLIFYILNLALKIQLFLGEARMFELRNNCSYTVWPASSLSSIPTLPLKNQDKLVVDVPSNQQGRLWGRTGCLNSTGKLVCQTGDCGSGSVNCTGSTAANTMTLVEFNLNGYNGADVYDVSVVNGYNVPILVDPESANGANCGATGCIFDVSRDCPSDLKLGGVCRSPCGVFQTAEYCCTGGIQCGLTRYSAIFKKACPRAYTYPQDDASTTYSCAGSPAYVVTFCPSSIKLFTVIDVATNTNVSSQSPPRSSPTPPIQPPKSKLPSSSSTPPIQPPKTNDLRKTKRRRLRTSVLVAAPTSIAISVLLLLGLWIRMNKRKAMKRNHQMEEIKAMESLQFDISTMKMATKNFAPDNKLGEGGFGEVYKGKLENGQEVAVKRLLQNSKQGDTEFKTEVILVAKLQHKNLVKLLGFCVTSKEKILIYEFLRNSSLDRFLFDLNRNSPLDWQTRLNIIVGIARGLLYLHEDSRLKVIHRDLKTSNILLDGDMNPKIADFGLAKLFGENQTQDDTKRIVGTRHGGFGMRANHWTSWMQG